MRLLEGGAGAAAQLDEAAHVCLDGHPGERDRGVRLGHVPRDGAASRAQPDPFALARPRAVARARGSGARRARAAGRPRRQRVLQVAEHVLARDAPVRAAAGHQREVDAVFRGEPADRGRVASRRRRGLRPRGRRRLGGRRGRARGLGRWLRGRRLGLGRGAVGGCDLGDRRADRDGLPFGHEDAGERALVRGGDLDDRLVRLDFDDRLVAGDEVAELLQPADDLALGHALADVGHGQAGHQRPRISRPPARASRRRCSRAMAASSPRAAC